MAKRVLLALTILISLSCRAQVADMEAAKLSAFTAAKNMDEAMVNRRYDDFVAYYHPKLLQKVEGGRDGMAVQIAHQVQAVEEAGNYITAIYPRVPDVVLDVNGEWQCAVQQFMEYRLPTGKIKTETTLVGISSDKGKTWYFLDVAGRKLADMQAIFPTLSNKLVIPAPKEPVFTADAETTAPAPKKATPAKAATQAKPAPAKAATPAKK